VGVNQAGHHPFFGKIDDLRIFWNREACANRGDFAVFDEDDLIPADGALGRIEQIPGADSDGLSGSRQNEGKKQNYKSSKHVVSPEQTARSITREPK
jgi:hypothetical protein